MTLLYLLFVDGWKFVTSLLIALVDELTRLLLYSVIFAGITTS